MESLVNIPVIEQRRLFLDAIFRNNPYQMGLRAINPLERRKAFCNHRDDDFINYYIDKYNTDFNIYFIVNSVWAGGKKEHVKLVNAFFADFDAKDYGGNFTPITQKIDGFKFTPSFMNHSGNGIHCYWILEKPLEVGREIGRTQFEAIQKGLALHLVSDPAVTDLNNVMRLPGAFNVKDPNNRKLCRVMAMSDNRYTLEQFMEFQVDEIVSRGYESDFKEWVTDNDMVMKCMGIMNELDILADWETTGIEMKFFCPLHGDGRNPNGRLNVQKGLWNCLSCKEGGTVKRLREILMEEQLRRIIRR